MGLNKIETMNPQELFSLYKSLVGPFQEFEKRSYRKRELEWKIKSAAEDAQRTVRFNYKKVIRKAFAHTLIWAIPFLIVFYIIMNVVHVNEEKLFYYYSVSDPAEAVAEAIEEKIEDKLSEKADIAYEIVAAFIICVPLPCLRFLFPLMIVGNVIPEVRHVSQAKKKKEESLKTCEACKELLPQAEAAIQEAWKRIGPFVKYIPPDYRNSSALAFFSKSFFNLKVKNLTEAVNLYDQYLHQQRMEESQREIANAQREAQRESMAAIDALSGQMAYMHDQIQDQIDSLYYRYY